jgi:hypothetical protein
MSEVLKTERQEALKRVPPGDRWEDATDRSDIFDSLTEAIEYMFQKTGHREYHISPLEGVVYSVYDVEDAPPPPAPIKKYDIYGEKEI